MIIVRTDNFKKQYKKLPSRIREKFELKLLLLISDLRYPSIQIKKLQGKEAVWEGRVDLFYRFTFRILGDNIELHSIGPHDEALK